MALYHKHRPQTFSSVIGQDHIVTTLSNQISTEKFAHAYLFSGPRGVGKTTLARVVAKAINCQNRKKTDSEPCDKCASCQEISNSSSIDVIEIDAASHTGVDNVRENIIDNAQFKPTRSPYKIFIIDEVHMLSTSAFNALLKTLEEPPAHVIFILATTELNKLPATIISRCQRYDFKKVGFETMKKHLKNVAKEEDVKIDDEILEKIISKSDGCVRDAISLLDQIMATGEKQITTETASLVLPNTNVEQGLKFLNNLIDRDTKSSLELIQQLVENGTNFFQFTNDIIELLHSFIMIKLGVKTNQTEFNWDEKTKKEIKKISEPIPEKHLVNLIDLLIKRSGQIKSSPIPQLPLEMAIIEWCGDNSGSNQPDRPQEKIEKITTEDNQINKETTKKTIVEKVKDLVSKPADFTIEEVNSKWPEFISKVENQHPSLAFIVKMAEVSGLDGETVIVSVPYVFHQDKIMEKTCQKNLENILAEVLGKKSRIEAQVIHKEDNSNDELQTLAADFGGEVIA